MYILLLQLLAVAVHAAPPKQKCSTPDISSTGPARILLQNDLSFTLPAGALLLSRPIASVQTAQACAAFDETSLPQVSPSTIDQLSYLVYSGELSKNALLWINTWDEHKKCKSKCDCKKTCAAWSVSKKQVVSVNCKTNLPALCTQSASPYRAKQLNDTASSYLVSLSGSGSTVTGFRDARSFRFLGIPFAKPPLGELRFEQAQPVTRLAKKTSALAYGPACIQEGDSIENQLQSEDCLNLNVYTPALGLKKLLPVAVWVYGGGFETGSGALPLYDGGNQASRSDIVVVTLNYRLGAFGALASSSVLDGSQGTSDQIAALKWVKANIAKFGGDPRRVTIYGESAGAQSVAAVLSSSSSKGLYQAAISESNPIGITFFNRGVWPPIFSALAEAVGCSNAGDEAATVACLKAAPASSFIDQDTTRSVSKASSDSQKEFLPGATLSLTSIEAYLPTVGTVPGVVDDHFYYLVGNKTLPNGNIPFMIGNNANESTLFVDAVIKEPLPNNELVYDTAVRINFGDDIANVVSSNPRLFPLNRTDPDGVRNACAQLLTLFAWQCPLQQIIDNAADNSIFSQLYSYRMDRGFPFNPDIPPACIPGAAPDGQDQVCHTEDLLEVFASSNVNGIPFNSENSLAYTQYIADQWGSFIRTRNPNPPLSYFAARGAAYAQSAALNAKTSFGTYSPASASALQLYSLDPSNSPPVYQEQCTLLQPYLFINTQDNAY